MCVLMFYLIEEVRSISLSLFVKGNNNIRVILLTLCFMSRVSNARFPSKDQKRLISGDSIYKDSNLERKLPLIVAAFPLL